MPKVEAQEFWQAFATELPSRLKLLGNWRETYEHDTPMTAFMTTFLTHLGAKLKFTPDFIDGQRGIQTEWCRVDVSYFDIHPAIEGYPYNWDWQVAIEHENNSTDWLCEFTKLCHISCGLKVLISYYETESIERLGIAKRLYAERKYCSPNDNWLVILGPSIKLLPGDSDYAAYKFEGIEFERLKDIPVLRTLK